MTKAVYEMLLGYMQSCVADRAHDENHVLRVLSNALQIAREEPQADLDILMAACLLHDVAWREEMETPGVRHAEAGAGKARAFLQRQGFSAEFCSRVADCIAAHSFGSGPAPARIEEKILFDADKLDAAGALGTARMLLYHGAAGDPIYEVRADGQVIDGVGDAQRNYFYEYHGMIAQMAGSMLTPAGRRMAQARAQTALQLYQAIYDEAQGCHLALRQALDGAFS